MRVGVVVKVIVDKKVGFIRSIDLKEDVFFHFSKVEKSKFPKDLEEGDEVEYEIDELQRLNKSDRIQATTVRRATRPLSVKIKPSDAPKLRAKHHPNARKRRPTWRSRPTGSDAPPSDSTE